MKRILAISSLLLCAFVLPSQNSLPFTCGTEHLEDIKQEMLKNREEFKNLHIQRGLSIIYLSKYFWLHTMMVPAIYQS